MTAMDGWPLSRASLLKGDECLGGREFKKLQAKWYRKLKRTGFKDIEARGTLSSRGNGAKSNAVWVNAEVIEERSAFYRLASQFFHDFDWKDKKDKRIWELFADGKSVQQIANAIGYSKGGTHKRLKKLIQGPFQDYRKMVFHDAN